MRSELVYKAQSAMPSRFQLCIVTAKITRGMHRGGRIQDSMNQALQTVEESGELVIRGSDDEERFEITGDVRLCPGCGCYPCLCMSKDGL